MTRSCSREKRQIEIFRKSKTRLTNFFLHGRIVFVQPPVSVDAPGKSTRVFFLHRIVVICLFTGVGVLFSASQAHQQCLNPCEIPKIAKTRRKGVLAFFVTREIISRPPILSGVMKQHDNVVHPPRVPDLRPLHSSRRSLSLRVF